MTARRRRIAVDDDSGAVLILALVIVTIVALVVGGLLSLSGTNLRTTVAMRAQSAAAVTADAAGQAAINELQRSQYNNDTSAGSAWPKCFRAPDPADPTKLLPSDTLTLANVVPGGTGSADNSAAVRCTPQPGTGVDGGLVPITDENKPGQAILTLSQDPRENGLYLKPLSSTVPFIVHGGVVSNSNIVVDGGTLQSNTDVYAHTGCSGTIQAPYKKCDAGTVADPGTLFPARYAPDTTTLPPLATVPTNCSGSVVTFSPGYYRDAKALTDLTNSNGCKGKVFWFKPGTYYFDFQNTAKSAGISDPHQWVISVGQLVAGTPVDASGKPLSPGVPPQVPATVPGACLNPIDNPTENLGVQFIFGGDSQFQALGTADVEICGSYHKDRPPIAVYGVRDSTVATPTPSTLTATAAKSTGNNAFTTLGNGPNALPDAVKKTDGTFASWTTQKAGDSATLTLSPFLSSPGIPARSTISSAQLRVVYGTANAASTRKVTVTPSSGAAFTKGVDVSAQGSGFTPVPPVDLTADLQAIVDANALTSLQVAYTTTMPGTGSEQIDGVYLDLTYTPPGLRASSGCLSLPHPQTGTSGCALLYSPESYSGKFYIQGTTYAPLAPIDISLSNVSEQVMRFGVISRTLAVKETGGFSYSGPVIEIPTNSFGYGLQGTVVYLDVYVCENTSTCSTSTGRLRLRARVFIQDPNGARKMLVQSWTVLR